MPSVFLIQVASGACLALALCGVHRMAWRYLRLMGIVCFALFLLAGMLLVRDLGNQVLRLPMRAGPLLAAALVFAVVWLVVNAMQGGRIRPAQRVWMALAGGVGLAASIGLTLRADPQVAPIVASLSGSWARPATTGASIGLGAMLLGSLTAAMLLGHRYLTDTGMTILPLRQLTRVFIAAVIARAVWVGLALRPVWSDRSFFANVATDPNWMWLILAIRVLVGLVLAGVFAYMAWDCARLRSTQSATGILFFAMIPVFLGELSAQYLLRSAALAV